MLNKNNVRSKFLTTIQSTSKKSSIIVWLELSQIQGATICYKIIIIMLSHSEEIHHLLRSLTE